MRVKNTLRNMGWNLIGQLALILTGLFMKKVLIHAVGIEKIGLNYLFNDIVGLLSVAELGLTGIIAYHLYEPLAKGDEVQVIKIMGFFRKSYFAIGCFVIIIGIALMPFLSFFVGNTSIDYMYMYILFILFLLRNTEGYFFSYKYILPYADQKSYIVVMIDIITTVIYSVISVIVIIYTRNFLHILFLEIIKKIINDFIMVHIVNKMYPYIKTMKKTSLNKAEKIKIGMDIKDAFVSKVSKAVISTTDNILMTKFLGLSITGKFSNYTLVLYTIQTVLQQLISSAQASIGNLMVTEKEDVVYSVVSKITFISFFAASISGCCLLHLSTPFVILFFGENYALSQMVVLVSVFNIFLDIIQKSMIQLSEAGGLFNQLKRINFLSCITNVILSIIGVQTLGIVGVLLGTLISRVIEYILRIKLNFREIFSMNLKKYITQVVGYFILFVLELGIVQLICYFILIKNPYMEFAVDILVAGSVPLLLNSILYYDSEDFRYMLNLTRMLLQRRIFMQTDYLKKNE